MMRRLRPVPSATPFGNSPAAETETPKSPAMRFSTPTISSSELPMTNAPRKSMAKARAALPGPRAACVAVMVEPLLSRRLVRRTVANARRGIGRRVAGRSCRPVVTGSGVVFVGYAHRGTADMQAEWERASLRLLPRLLAAEGGEVEVAVAVAVVELLDAAAVRGVGVEDLLTDPQERADARQFCAAHALRPRSARPRCSGLGQPGFGAEVDQQRRRPTDQGGVE